MTKTADQSSERPFIVTNTPLAIVVIGLVLLAVFGGLWWTRVYNTPRRVFADMLANNLSTTSVTKQSTITDQAGYSRVEQLSFVPPVATRSYVKLTQEANGGKATVQSETIGTLRNDYSKYLKIDVDQVAGQAPKNYASVENVWAKSSQSSATGGRPEYLVQALQGLLPFANLSASQRAQILKTIDQKKIYTINYASTKQVKLGGKSAIDYSVSVNPSQYITMLQELAKMVGVDELPGLNAEDYKDQPPIGISVVVDKLSRQVLQVTYGQQKETYSAYGLTQPITVPEKTIPDIQLQQRIQAVQ